MTLSRALNLVKLHDLRGIETINIRNGLMTRFPLVSKPIGSQHDGIGSYFLL